MKNSTAKPTISINMQGNRPVICLLKLSLLIGEMILVRPCLISFNLLSSFCIFVKCFFVFPVKGTWRHLFSDRAQSLLSNTQNKLIKTRQAAPTPLNRCYATRVDAVDWTWRAWWESITGTLASHSKWLPSHPIRPPLPSPPVPKKT